ncbi:MAG: radical SAM protein [Desulfobacteraceae bacterium]|nr:radical SAM protein [Desulfobacteraceae bacterium]MCF8093960.1 radical SAM protein [Desulfobacteraceae bacterium]
MSAIDWREAWLRLHPQAALKKLETPFVYHTARDELYEIDARALEFLKLCNGTRTGRELTEDADFVEYCIEEQILEALERPDEIRTRVDTADSPSLRYLELHLTHRCNLRCRHCYLGPPADREMDLEDAKKIARQFAENGGLRLLVSGGEPMLYHDIEAFLEQTRGLGIRRILFTNGTLVTQEKTGRLATEEIVFSMDGWQHGHEALRGEKTFGPLIRGIKAAKNAGIDISFSTMIHRENLGEFEQMQKFIKDAGAVEWGVDILTVTGALAGHQELCVPFETAAPLMEYAFGGGYHGSSDGYACGRHLMAVMPDGQAVKCGFYSDSPLGDARENLAKCWRNMSHIRLDELECRDCEFLLQCRGGCRFRAPGPFSPDPVMCRIYGADRGQGDH